MIDELSEAGALVKAASALGGLVIPAGVMLTLAELPGEVGRPAALLGATAGIIVVLLVITFSSSLRKLRPMTVGVFLIATAIAGATTLVRYSTFASAHTIPVPPLGKDEEDTRTRIYIIPHRPSSDLKRLVGNTHGDFGLLLESPARKIALSMMTKDDGPTVVLIILYFVLSEALLVFAIVMSAWWLVGRRETPAGPRASSHNKAQ